MGRIGPRFLALALFMRQFVRSHTRERRHLATSSLAEQDP
jgi:hypothetical protein